MKESDINESLLDEIKALEKKNEQLVKLNLAQKELILQLMEKIKGDKV